MLYESIIKHKQNNIIQRNKAVSSKIYSSKTKSMNYRVKGAFNKFQMAPNLIQYKLINKSVISQ